MPSFLRSDPARLQPQAEANYIKVGPEVLLPNDIVDTQAEEHEDLSDLLAEIVKRLIHQERSS